MPRKGSDIYRNWTGAGAGGPWYLNGSIQGPALAGTSVLRVDYKGRGDFSTIKAAADFALTESPEAIEDDPPFGGLAPGWTIAVTPGPYHDEQPFTLPADSHLVCMHHPNQQGIITQGAQIWWTETAGNLITAGRNCRISGFSFQLLQGTSTGEVNMIHVPAPGQTNYVVINDCLVRSQLGGTSHNINLVNFEGGGAADQYLWLFNCQLHFVGASGLNEKGRGLRAAAALGSDSYVSAVRTIFSGDGDARDAVLADAARVGLDHCDFTGFQRSVTAENSSEVTVYGGTGTHTATANSGSTISAALPPYPTALSSPGFPGQISIDTANNKLAVCCDTGWHEVSLTALPA